jgi:hypothetical protein
VGKTVDPWQCCDADLDYWAQLYASVNPELAAALLAFKIWRRSPMGCGCDAKGPHGEPAPFFIHEEFA